jgi:2-phosphoglycerate kinase
MYRINATDTVRQVMRMVFSPAVLPALHRSSYELDEEGEGRRPSRRRVEAAFLEQAVRVLVGVRAVVERLFRHPSAAKPRPQTQRQNPAPTASSRLIVPAPTT